MKKLLTIGVFALALAGGANAQVYVRFGPPPPPREVMIARPGPRHVWIPGHYRWSGSRYHWNRGYWSVPPRHRAVWVPGHWSRRHGGYVWIGGYWR